jgi:cell division protein FtsB
MEGKTITTNNGIIVETDSSISGTTNDKVKKLETLIAVYNQGALIMKTGMAIKMTALAIIDYTNLYAEKGYENVIDFASKELKLSAQTTRRYLQTAKKFYDIETLAQNFNVNDLLDEKGNFKKISTFKINSVLADSKGNDFTPTTLNDIVALPLNTVKELLDKKEISYDMTGNEIKTAIAPYRKQAKKTLRQSAKISGTTNDTNNNSEIDELTKLKNQIAALQAENQKLKKENEELKEKITTEKISAENELKNIQTENETLQAENKQLKNSNNSFKSANSKMKNINATLQAEIETLKSGAVDNAEKINTATNENITIVG